MGKSRIAKMYCVHGCIGDPERVESSRPSCGMRLVHLVLNSFIMYLSSPKAFFIKLIFFFLCVRCNRWPSCKMCSTSIPCIYRFILTGIQYVVLQLSEGLYISEAFRRQPPKRDFYICRHALTNGRNIQQAPSGIFMFPLLFVILLWNCLLQQKKKKTLLC